MAAATVSPWLDRRWAHTFNAAGLRLVTSDIPRNLYDALAGKNGNLINHAIVGHPFGGHILIPGGPGDVLSLANATSFNWNVPGKTTPYYVSSWNIYAKSQHAGI